jgi:hypothetical protein
VIYGSTNGGSNWVKNSLPPTKNEFYFALSIPSPTVAYAISDSVILKTITGGLGVITTSTSTDITPTPNPAHDYIWVNIPKQAKENSIGIYDNIGREVGVVKLSSGVSPIRLDIHSLSCGIYELRLGQQIYRFIKQ